MPGPVPISQTDFGSQKGVNVANGSAATDVAAYGQVTAAQAAAIAAAQGYTDNQIAGLQSGQTLKGTVRAYTATNINITSPGSTIDGLTPQLDDIFWLGGQTTGSQGGPQQWKGASTPMVRPANWDTQAEAVIGSYWIVREGSSADTFVMLTNDAFTLGTTTPVAKLIGIAAAAQVNGYSEVNPATAAGAVWTATHNLGTDKVNVQVWRTAAPKKLVTADIGRPSTTQVSIYPDVALAAGDYEVVITKAV